MMDKDDADRMVKYLVLSLLQEWYLAGKTETSLGEIYETLGVRDDGDEPSELDHCVLTIGEEILTLDTDHLDAMINRQIH